MTWDTFLTLRGTKGIYLDHVGTLRPSKSWGWGGLVVAHEILVSAQVPLVLGLGLRVWGLGLTISLNSSFKSFCCIPNQVLDIEEGRPHQHSAQTNQEDNFDQATWHQKSGPLFQFFRGDAPVR